MNEYGSIDLRQACENGFVLAIYRKGVEFGSWDKKMSCFPWETDKSQDAEDLLELHIFDENSEFRAIRSERGNAGYLTTCVTDDSMREKHDYDFFVDCNMLIFGDEYIADDGSSVIIEESGRRKKFYFPCSRELFDKGLYLKVRDYYSYDENHLLYLSGYRMTGFGEENKHE